MHTVVMRPATAYGKCYILYLFVTVILLSLTSLHMCVVVAAEGPLEENVVAELKEKAGEVEGLAGDVKEANEEIVKSAERVLSLLTKAAKKIDGAVKENTKLNKEQKDKWAATLDATNSAKDKAQKAVQNAKKIQNAANKAGGAMQKMAARAKDVVGDVENVRSLIGEFKNETDTTVSLWGEVSSDDVQSLVEATSAIVEETNRAKREAENVPHKTEKDLNMEESFKEKEPSAEPPKLEQAKTDGETAKADVGPPREKHPETSEKHGTEKQLQSQQREPRLTLEPNEQLLGPGVEPEGGAVPVAGPRVGQEEGPRREEAAVSKVVQTSVSSPVDELQAQQLKGDQDTDSPARTLVLIDPPKVNPALTKKMRLTQAETAAENAGAGEVQHNNKIKNKKVVESLGEAAEEAKKLREAAQSVKEKINKARRASERVAQLADTVTEMRESKELSVPPSLFGSLVFVVNSICLTTVVTLTYVLGNTL